MATAATTRQNEIVSLPSDRPRRQRVSALLNREALPLVVLGLCGLANPELVEAWADQLEDCLLRVVLHYGSGRQDMELAIGRHETGTLRRVTLSAMPVERKNGEWFPVPTKNRALADTGWVPAHDPEQWSLLLEAMLATAMRELVSGDEVRRLAERGRRAMMSGEPEDA